MLHIEDINSLKKVTILQSLSEKERGLNSESDKNLLRIPQHANDTPHEIRDANQTVEEGTSNN